MGAYVSPWIKHTGILQIVTDQGNIDLPDPESIAYSVQDIDSASTGRGLDGTMDRDRVAVKEKLKITFPPMQAADAQKVLGLISGVEFMCRYWSVKNGGPTTAQMYAGDRSANAYYMYKGTNTDLWTDLTVDFIEM